MSETLSYIFKALQVQQCFACLSSQLFTFTKMILADCSHVMRLIRYFSHSCFQHSLVTCITSSYKTKKVSDESNLAINVFIHEFNKIFAYLISSL